MFIRSLLPRLYISCIATMLLFVMLLVFKGKAAYFQLIMSYAGYKFPTLRYNLEVFRNTENELIILLPNSD